MACERNYLISIPNEFIDSNPLIYREGKSGVEYE